MDLLQERLASDLSGLTTRFGVVGPVVHVEGGLSDPHAGGQTVGRVRFERGVVYYKPRPLAIDVAGLALVAWLRERGLDLRVPEVWDRGAYGWAAGVEAAPVEERGQAARFYRRLGAWAALGHALGSSDLHAENWVAAGEHPVLVDLETLLGPTPRGSRLDEGVLRALLVTYVVNGQDLAPLAPPGLLGERWPAVDFRAEVLAGFEQAYRLVQAHGLPLDAFAGATVRLLIQHTHEYAEGRSRALRGPLGELERAALARGDIPHFGVKADERDVRADGVCVPGVLRASPLEVARTRLAGLSDEDLREQLDVLALALAPSRTALPGRARTAADGAGAAAAAPLPGAACDGAAAASLPGAPALRFEPLALAEAIAVRLRQHTVPRGDGGVTWVVRMATSPTLTEMALLDVGLWDGALGPALFLAALGRATGERAWLELARRALPVPVFGRPLATVQLAGLAYGLTLWGQLTGEEISVLPWLAMVDPAADTIPDVIGGLGGALQALLRVPGGEAAALACAERLLQLREPLDGTLAWRSAEGTFRAGYGHGQAGIAANLLALDAVAPDARWREAAATALALEQRWFEPDYGDWRLPVDGGPWFMGGWCAGAPGMALARLGVPEERPALEAALKRMQSTGPLAFDHPCCGTAGRVEVALEAGRRLDRPELLAFAREQLATLRLTEGYQDRDPRYLKGIAGLGWALLRGEAPESLPCLLG